jgi:transposase
MSGKRYTEEFKREAVKQVLERGYSALEVSERLGVANKSIYDWIAKYGNQKSPQEQAELEKEQAENRRLRAELRRVTEERDILKKAAAFFANMPE